MSQPSSVSLAESVICDVRVEAPLGPPEGAAGDAAAPIADQSDASTESGPEVAGGLDSPTGVTEVVQPMEMAELVDILPTAGLIEEETSCGLSSSSVRDLLESFGLGIDENSSVFSLGAPDVISGSETLRENAASEGHDATISDTSGAVSVLSSDSFPEDPNPHSKGCFPLRSQVEWDRPINGSS